MKKSVFVFFVSVSTMFLMLTSCGDDGETMVQSEQESQAQSQSPDSSSWIEPYHIMGGKRDDAKSYMSSYLTELTLSEVSSDSSNQLVYTRNDGSIVGILYCFSPVNGGLLSVIDTEDVNCLSQVLACLRRSYVCVRSSDDGYLFTNEKNDMTVTVAMVAEGYFNVTYCSVSR